jgi:hypothetical protein
MSEMGRAGAGAGIFAGIVAAIGGLADDCGRLGARVGSRAPALADDVAHGVGRAGRGVAPGAGRAGRAPGIADDFLPAGGGLGDDAARAAGARAARGAPLAGATDDALRAGGRTLEQDLVEAGLDLADLAVELVPLDEAPEPPPLRPSFRPPIFLGLPGAVALGIDADAVRAEHLSRFAPLGAHEDAATAVARRARIYAPLTVLGRADASGEALLLASETSSGGRSIPLATVLGACTHAGASCIVLACEVAAPPTCEDAIARVWSTAASALRPSGTSRSAALASLLRSVLSNRAREPDARASFVARLDRGETGARLVVTRPARAR